MVGKIRWYDIVVRGEKIGKPILVFASVIFISGIVLAALGLGVPVDLIAVSLGFFSIALGCIAIGLAKKNDILAHYHFGRFEEESSAELDLARHSCSGEYPLSGQGTEDELYNSGEQRHPFLFGNAWVRLDGMKEGDVVRIRLYIREAGKWSRVSRDEENTYSGMQGTMKKIDGGFYNKEGVRITAEQISVNSSRVTVGCYIYDAARGN